MAPTFLIYIFPKESLNVWRLIGVFACLKIRALFKTEQAGNDAAWELTDPSVIVLHCFVEALSFGENPVLATFQLSLKR